MSSSQASINYADYKRAIRGSKKTREEDKKQPVKELPKPTIVWQPRRWSSSTSSSSNNKKSDSASNLSDLTGIQRTSSSSTSTKSSKGNGKRVGKPTSADAKMKQRIIDDQVEEGFEVFNADNNNNNPNNHQDLIIQASSTLTSVDEGLLLDLQQQNNNNTVNEQMKSNKPVEYTMSSDTKQPQHKTNSKETADDEAASISDSILSSLPSASDLIELAKSISYNTNDDSIFSEEGHNKGSSSPQRSVVVCTSDQKKKDGRTSAIDMTGCIRTSVSSPKSEDASNLNLENPTHPSTTHTSKDKVREEVVSEQQPQPPLGGNDSALERWQDFASLTLLGTPVLSWFSNATSDGVFASEDPHPNLPLPPSQESHKSHVATKSKQEVAADDMTGISSNKPKPPSSLSSTEGGSISVVGEVPSRNPKIQNSLLRQLFRCFTNCIPSKTGNRQGFYLFLFGISMITSALVLLMILLFVVPTESNDSLLAANSTMAPSLAPTMVASMPPSDSPSLVPSNHPTNVPTITPRPTVSQVPSENPSLVPTDQPSIKPTNRPTVTAVPTSEPLSYVPGKLTVKSNGLLLSEGLTSRIVARSGQKVPLNGRAYGSAPNPWNATSSSPTSAPTEFRLESEEVFHHKPDGAAAYPWPENLDYNGNGWIYVSNSEVWDHGGGGVGAIYFDDKGRVVDFKSLIKGTTANCAGGKTPWHTWVTCEEDDNGRIYQIDPLGNRPPEEMTIGKGRGKWESFAYDIRNPEIPRFFATEDKDSGTLRRFTPHEPSWEDPWTMLQANGTVDFLVLNPYDDATRTNGTFYWVNDLRFAKENARRYFQHSEGIDVRGNQLFVVSKTQKELFILDLDAMTYEVFSTTMGLFDGQPDQMKRLVADTDQEGTMHDKSLLYFCEEGGRNNGVHARDSNGWYFTILESDELDGETSGLAFSPDGKHMYFSYQHRGIIFDVWREDGRPFHAKTLSVKYHETGQITSQ